MPCSLSLVTLPRWPGSRQTCRGGRKIDRFDYERSRIPVSQSVRRPLARDRFAQFGGRPLVSAEAPKRSPARREDAVLATSEQADLAQTRRRPDRVKAIAPRLVTASLLCHTVPMVAPTAVVVAVGDHRAVCFRQPAAGDGRPRIRGVAPAWTGVAALPVWLRQRGPEAAPSLQRTRGGCVAASPVPSAPLTVWMMGHGLRGAEDNAERDGLRGAAFRPAGGGISW
jgi:hypothetical protein